MDKLIISIYSGGLFFIVMKVIGGWMDDFLTKQELASRLQIGIKTVEYLVTTGQLPFVRIGKRIVRFSESELDKYFAKQKNMKEEYRARG